MHFKVVVCFVILTILPFSQSPKPKTKAEVQSERDAIQTQMNKEKEKCSVSFFHLMNSVLLQV